MRDGIVASRSQWLVDAPYITRRVQRASKNAVTEDARGGEKCTVILEPERLRMTPEADILLGV